MQSYAFFLNAAIDPPTPAQEMIGAAALTFQVAVAGYALWLNRIFGGRRAGWALGGAFSLMFLMHLNEAWSPPVTVAALGLRPELAYLFISLLLLLGLSHLATLYRERQRAEEEIRAANDQLDLRVQNRTAELLRANEQLAVEVENRKKAESEIRASQQLYQGLVDSLDGIIFECETSHLAFTFVSSQCQRLLGYSAAEWMSGIRWRDIIHPEDYSLFADSCARAIAERTASSAEYRIRHQSGDYRWVRHLARVVSNREQQSSFCGVLLDMTERRQLEEQLHHAQKMEAVGRLAGGVAHDFNNILTVIQGYGQMLLDMAEWQTQTPSYLKLICGAATRGEHLARQLLAFSRRQAIHVQALELNQVVESTAQMIRVLLGEMVVLRQELAAELPSVKGDGAQLAQVLMNLAVNARDAMPNGGTLTIRTELISFTEREQQFDPSVQLGSFIRLSVADTGTGIPDDVLPRIFEPFFTTKDVGKGTGLGLSIVYGIIKQHGGWVKVQSQVGRGTSFHLYIPVTIEKAAQIEEQMGFSPRRGNNETILLVEDEPDVLNMAALVLKDCGYRVLTADSGPAALDVWAKHSEEISMVVTDVVMPEGMSGWQLVKQMRTTCPQLKALVTSGYTKDTEGDDNVTFLTKPYQPRTLAKAVQQALEEPDPVHGEIVEVA